jgi:hypothetical protein
VVMAGGALFGQPPEGIANEFGADGAGLGRGCASN